MHEIPVGPEIIALVAEGWPWTNEELNSHLSSPADILLYLRLRQLNPSSTMPRCPSGDVSFGSFWTQETISTTRGLSRCSYKWLVLVGRAQS